MFDFDLDKQTIKDLEIFVDNQSANSISKFYNQTKTFGGRKFLFQIMQNPITDLEELKQRTELIGFLQKTGFEIKMNSKQLDFIEHYQRHNITPLRNNFVDAFFQNLSYRINPNNNYYIIKAGVQQLLYLFNQLIENAETLEGKALPVKLEMLWGKVTELIENPNFKMLYQSKLKIGFSELSKLDHLFRKKYKSELVQLLSAVYQLDAYISVAKVANEKHLVMPEYDDTDSTALIIEDFYHPLLKDAVSYTIETNRTSNLCFLTGPNMAGKSTFLKSVGLMIYLAHIGFPVPAKKMTTSIYNGIVTTINLSDNLNLGYSHFYSEVHRIKETILKIKEKEKLFIIFDELFRGTNVKDAFDASLLIIQSFAKIPNSTFFISTHITEVAEKIKDIANIQFRFFDSKLVNNVPTYAYKLENGISFERLGMYILKHERIIDILDSITEQEI